MGFLARLPIRLRVTLAFAVAMAVVLAATGVFLYLRLGSALDRTIDQSLRARATDVGALSAGGTPPGRKEKESRRCSIRAAPSWPPRPGLAARF